jgi:hypothetical protein
MKAKIMTKATYRCCVATCCLLMIATAGCSTLTGPKNTKNSKKDTSWSLFKKKDYQVPQSINVTWTYDIFTKEGKPPTRGFGGRLYFYNEKSQAIPVEGELTVYGFDDTDRSHDGSSIESADKRFRFTAEQFTTHFSESELGASYSIWIPWDAAPGTQKKIMLIPTFKTKDGPVLRGNAATVLLPGVVAPEGEQRVIQASTQNGVQRASHTSSLPAGTALGQAIPGQAMSGQAMSGQAMSDQAPRDPAHRTTTIQYPARNYPTKPVLSAERASELLQQIQESQATPLPIPTAANFENGQMTITETRVPVGQVATQAPGFHLPITPMQGSTISGVGIGAQTSNGQSLPGFAQLSVVPRSVHSEPSSPPAQAESVAPSSAYPPR